MPSSTNITHVKVLGVYKDAHYEKVKKALQFFSTKKSDLKYEMQLYLPMDYELMILDMKKNPKYENTLIRYMKTSTSPLILVNDKYVVTPKDIYQKLAQDYEYEDRTYFPLYNRIACSEYAAFYSKLNRKKVEHVYMDFLVKHERHSLPSRVVFELFLDVVPKTCRNFLELIKGTTNADGKQLHYKGTTIHRIWKDGFIQGGDVDHQNGKGGQSIYGKYFEDENYVIRHDKPGLLGMAHEGGKRHTNGSQFYVTLAPLKAYDNKYVVFGRVVSGFRTIKFLNHLPAFGSKPSVEIEIVDCGIYKYELISKKRV
jgi:Peptidyl-prolyl cis-trans isomerase (rotamase) - cyclophilin family